jgi:hypothetical protein
VFAEGSMDVIIGERNKVHMRPVKTSMWVFVQQIFPLA